MGHQVVALMQLPKHPEISCQSKPAPACAEAFHPLQAGKHFAENLHETSVAVVERPKSSPHASVAEKAALSPTVHCTPPAAPASSTDAQHREHQLTDHAATSKDSTDRLHDTHQAAPSACSIFQQKGGLSRSIQIQHKRLSLPRALEVLSSPVLNPGEALQAAQYIANLSLDVSFRMQITQAAVLNTLLSAMRLHTREACSHVCMAIASTARDSRLSKIMSAHPALVQTLLEFAEPPTRSLPAGRALLLCVHALPFQQLDDGRILDVFKRLSSVEQTQIQTKVCFARRRIADTPYGLKVLQEYGW